MFVDFSFLEPRIGGRCKLVEEEDFRVVVETEEQRTAQAKGSVKRSI